MLRDAGRALADAIDASLGSWVRACVERRVLEVRAEMSSALCDRARAAGEQAVAEIGPRIRALLASDVDAQSTTPLSLVRAAVRYPTAVLRAEGVAPVARDAFALGRFPEDDYELTPASLAVLGEDVGELAIVWGAAKALEHKRRHRS